MGTSYVFLYGSSLDSRTDVDLEHGPNAKPRTTASSDPPGSAPGPPASPRGAEAEMVPVGLRVPVAVAASKGSNLAPTGRIVTTHRHFA